MPLSNIGSTDSAGTKIIARALSHQSTVWVVMIHLLHHTVLVYHHAVITQMILDVEMVRVAVVIHSNVSAVNEQLLTLQIFVNHIAAVVYQFCAGWHRCRVLCPKLRAVSTVSVLCGPAVGECYFRWQ